MKVYANAAVYDENLYRQLYYNKERKYIKSQKQFYNTDPRSFLIKEGTILLPKCFTGEEISEADQLIYRLIEEEKEQNQKLIEQYDNRPPFDEEKAREEFRYYQETVNINSIKERLPSELIQQIADLRVFTLGFCTNPIYKQLKRLSVENEKKVNQIFDEYEKAKKAEDIPDYIREKFGFHDCYVKEFIAGEDTIMTFDTSGGFTCLNKMVLVQSHVIKREEPIIGSAWIYAELYRTADGYEVHMLFDSETLSELTIRCKDIIIEKE
jgi:hypothetical protein